MKSSVRSLLLALFLCACSETPATTADGGGDTDGGGGGEPCAPGASCTRVGDCLAEVDQTGVAEPTLRISQLSVTAPAAFTRGIVRGVITGGFTPSAPACNLSGSGTANWILQITGGGTGLTLGAARPRASESGPYTLVNEMLGGLTIAPATATLSGSGTLTSTAFDVILPIYLDASGTQSVALPMHQVVVTMTPDASSTCVGRYNADTLDPENACQPDDTHSAFTNGGTIAGYITLEDADAIVIDSIGQSLCVLLSGDAAMYGDGARPIAMCKRTGGAIDFQGDWCSTTNAAATPDCHDAVQFTADFAASGVAQ